MNFLNYIVSSRQAVPENFYSHKFSKHEFEAFEQWKVNKSFLTDAPDGCWPVEDFELVFQWWNSIIRKWVNDKHVFEGETFDQYAESHNESKIKTRQFLKYKHPIKEKIK